MAATQRPVTQEALVEPSGERPLWKELPSWFVFGEEDRNIPKAVEHYMAERAGAHRTIEIPGASHAVPVAHPGTTARPDPRRRRAARGRLRCDPMTATRRLRTPLSPPRSSRRTPRWPVSPPPRRSAGSKSQAWS